jgi:hypothetical protein
MTGEVNGQIIDGDMVGEKYTYTVKNYAECILENATPLFDYTKAGHITKSLLNYGAYSQMYFNHEESNLANDTELMTEEEKDVSSVTATTLEKYKYVKTGQSSYIKYGGSSLYLLSATTLRLYFLPSNGVNIDDVTFTCEGETLEADKSGSYYYVDIDGISAEDLDKTYTINVSCKGESFDINYSVLTYCYNVLKKTATDEDTMELKNTMAALYLYNQSAEKYFSSTSDEITETYGE